MTIDEIMLANADAGFHFFDKDTLRFFKSKVLPEVYEGPGGVYFITSEKGPVENSQRRYTVRRFNTETKNVSTVPPFNMQPVHEARKQAYHLAITPIPTESTHAR